MGKWLKGKRGIASAVAIALVAGVPVTFAVLHPGFPVSDVKLSARDVWVTNSNLLTAGRLNHQISALDGSVKAASNKFDVYQDGETTFVQDESNSKLQRVDPAFATLQDPISLPPDAQVNYGGTNIAVVAPSTGKLWVVNASGKLSFDPTRTAPNVTLGRGGEATVAADGTVYAVSPSGALYTIPVTGGQAQKKSFPSVTDFQLSVVGNHPVVLDTRANTLIREDGSKVKLPGTAEKLQQSGLDNTFALVSTADSLLEVDLAGSAVTTIPAKITAVKDAKAVAAPVWLDGCANAAWSSGGRYLLACSGANPITRDIPGADKGGELVFRVNRSVIVLNNTQNGDSWVLNSAMTVVSNWAEVTPPENNATKDGEHKTIVQTFEEALATRTPENHPPVALDDTLGARPGRTTILPVLDNDTDADGDVLTIPTLPEIDPSIGKLDLVNGSRALQFTPADGFSGALSFRYTVSDGRPGGVSSANVTVNVRALPANSAPVSARTGATTVEAGQSTSYNVLNDWLDPDGDDLQLVSAEAESADSVRFTPDGFINFQHTSAEIGVKKVKYTVSDGNLTATGELSVDVKPDGTLKPVAVPDYATGYTGGTITISPLKNDKSPSGQPLTLVSAKPLIGSAQFTVNVDLGTVQINGPGPGDYYFEYTVAAGPQTTVGIIRIDVTDPPAKPAPPIAVKDTVYLLGGQPTLVPVLDNDVSSGDKVLAVQSFTVPNDARSLSVELLNNTELRITAPDSLDIKQQLQLQYTISDGTQTSTAAVTIVPVAPLVKHQAPVAVDDTSVVRAGDVVTVPVLANDYHPDGALMTVDPVLADPGTAGLAFVSGNTVRYQAPTTPGQYSVVYKVTDAFQESATAKVTFTVLAPDEKTNRPPLPIPIVSRAFAGSDVRVNVPLNGTDPDGDSVSLVAFPALPSLGQIVSQGSDYFTYKAGASSAGTDSFTYQVIDSYGASAIGSVKIGVIPRGGNALQPTAVKDSISMRPGRIASVDVLANDSDPNGYAIKVEPKLVVSKGITASVIDNRVVVHASAKEGTYEISYTLTNGHAGTATTTVTVVVDKNAPAQFPTVVDHVLQQKQLLNKSTVPVNVLSDAQNPGGLVKDLVVTLTGPNAKTATVSDKGVITVTPTNTKRVIAYKATNAIDKLSATAFVIVPAKPKTGFTDPPRLKKGLAPVIPTNSTKSWALKDIVDVPSGKPALITTKGSVTATHSDGGEVYQDATDLTFTTEKDYRGPASITFEVTDGKSANDKNGQKATLTLNFVIGDPQFEDQSPTFTQPAVSVPADGDATVDLRASTAHPNPDVLKAITYGNLTGATSDVTANLSGSSLKLSAPRNAKIGAVVTLKFVLTYKQFTVNGSVKATVVSSLKPLAVAVTDTLKAKRNVVTVVHPLDNDSNPFPDTPLKIVSATLQNTASGAQLSNTDSTITVTPGPSFIGDVSINYVVQDATGDATRRVTGQIIVTVWDVPDKPAAPTIARHGDKNLTVNFTAPTSINGSPVSVYRVSSSAGATITSCKPGDDCVFSNLNNGQAYTFTVIATNEVGDSQASNASAPGIPYGTPAAPSSAHLTGDPYATASLNLSWGATPDSGGGTVTYKWQFTQGASDGNQTGGLSASASKGTGTYAFQVQACNADGLCSGYTASNAVTVSDPPPKATLTQGSFESGTSNAYHYHVKLENFGSGNVSIVCYDNGGSQVTAAYVRPGTFDGELGCFSGYKPYYVVVNGNVQSNTVSAWQ